MKTSDTVKAFSRAMHILGEPGGDPFTRIIDGKRNRNTPISNGGLRIHFGPKDPSGLDEFRTFSKTPASPKYSKIFSPRGLWYAFDLSWLFTMEYNSDEDDADIGRNIFDLMIHSHHLTYDLKDAGKHMILVVRDFEDAVDVHSKYANDKGYIWNKIKQDFDGLEVRFQTPNERELDTLIIKLLPDIPNQKEHYSLGHKAIYEAKIKGLFMPWLFNLEFPSGVIWTKSNTLAMMRPLPLLGLLLPQYNSPSSTTTHDNDDDDDDTTTHDQ